MVDDDQSAHARLQIFMHIRVAGSVFDKVLGPFGFSYVMVHGPGFDQHRIEPGCLRGLLSQSRYDQ